MSWCLSRSEASTMFFVPGIKGIRVIGETDEKLSG